LLKLVTILVPLLFGTGCAAPETRGREDTAPPPPLTRSPPVEGFPAGPVPRRGTGDLALARVGGEEIRRSDLGEFVVRYFREQATEGLTHLIDERMIEAEARALGVVVPPTRIEEEVAAELARREERIRVEYGPAVSLSEYLAERYGTTPEGHRRDLGRLVRIRMLRDRVVRYRQLLEERIELRDAVFADATTARKAAEAARRGADLGRLAADRGVRERVALPPVTRDGISPPELAEMLFGLSSGEVTDPVAITEDGSTLYHVFKLVDRSPAARAGWAEVREAVEADLAERPLETQEYLEWSRRMRERYQVEILR
jgi:hypothetical protein